MPLYRAPRKYRPAKKCCCPSRLVSSRSIRPVPSRLVPVSSRGCDRSARRRARSLALSVLFVGRTRYISEREPDTKSEIDDVVFFSSSRPPRFSSPLSFSVYLSLSLSLIRFGSCDSRLAGLDLLGERSRGDRGKYNPVSLRPRSRLRSSRRAHVAGINVSVDSRVISATTLNFRGRPRPGDLHLASSRRRPTPSSRGVNKSAACCLPCVKTARGVNERYTGAGVRRRKFRREERVRDMREGERKRDGGRKKSVGY